LRDYEDMLLLLSILDNSHLLRPLSEETKDNWYWFYDQDCSPAPSR